MEPNNPLYRVQVCNLQRRYRVNAGAVEALCSCVLDSLGEGPAALNVAIVNAASMRDLNRKFRGHDYATDVLGFAYVQVAAAGVKALGEVVVSPQAAFSQAESWRTSPEAEMKRLIVHGVLHLLGYDHETDGGEMLNLQRRLLRRRAVARCGPVLRGVACR